MGSERTRRSPHRMGVSAPYPRAVHQPADVPHARLRPPPHENLLQPRRVHRHEGTVQRLLLFLPRNLPPHVPLDPGRAPCVSRRRARRLPRRQTRQPGPPRGQHPCDMPPRRGPRPRLRGAQRLHEAQAQHVALVAPAPVDPHPPRRLQVQPRRRLVRILRPPAVPQAAPRPARVGTQLLHRQAHRVCHRHRRPHRRLHPPRRGHHTEPAACVLAHRHQRPPAHEHADLRQPLPRPPHLHPATPLRVVAGPRHHQGHVAGQEDRVQQPADQQNQPHPRRAPGA